MKIKSFTKKSICVALLAGASVGANAAPPVVIHSSATYDLGAAGYDTPLPFAGSVITVGKTADIFTFGDFFAFSLPVNGGSGYSVVAFDVKNPADDTYYFKTLLTTATLYSDPLVGSDFVVATASEVGNKLNLTWGALAAGNYYLQVSGTVQGTIGGLYNGAISVAAPPVPEPESYAMFLAGLGLMGVIVRRRMRNQS